jgi:hypothetical protein
MPLPRVVVNLLVAVGTKVLITGLLFLADHLTHLPSSRSGRFSNPNHKKKS